MTQGRMRKLLDNANGEFKSNEKLVSLPNFNRSLNREEFKASDSYCLTGTKLENGQQVAIAGQGVVPTSLANRLSQTKDKILIPVV